jgi:hypothetical protein
MVVILQKFQTSLNHVLSSFDIDLTIATFSPIVSQISIETHRHRRARKWEVLKIHPGELMAHWTFELKFPYDSQFLFVMLMFAVGEDETLELLTQAQCQVITS